MINLNNRDRVVQTRIFHPLTHFPNGSNNQAKDRNTERLSGSPNEGQAAAQALELSSAGSWIEHEIAGTPKWMQALQAVV